MKNTYSITEAQAKLPSLVRETACAEPIAITRHGDTVAYLISKDRVDAVIETMELLGDPDAMKALRQYKAGKLRFHGLEKLDESR